MTTPNLRQKIFTGMVEFFLLHIGKFNAQHKYEF